MAEGWAHKWIQDQLYIFKTTLQEFQEEDQKGDDFNDDKLARRVKEHIVLLESTAVASVALDSSAVFDASSSSDIASAAMSTLSCRGNDCRQRQRKQVKSKAVEAMSKDGVDISLYQPKTIDEILPVLTNEAKALSVEKDDVTSQININNKILVNAVIEEMDSAPTKSVDKLIVLCSCGEELKYELTRRSKSVEEWSIDAPTAASKAGEGDQAYQRVSLEIKKEVNILMGSLLPKPFF
jgi:protein-tyrosine-phosphatase